MRWLLKYPLRALATFRGWRATRRLRARGVYGRVVDVAKALHDPTFKNVFRRAVTAKMQRKEPIKTAQEIAELALFLLRNKFHVDTADVQIQLTWDPRTGVLEMAAVPEIEAIRKAFGMVR